MLKKEWLIYLFIIISTLSSNSINHYKQDIKKDLYCYILNTNNTISIVQELKNQGVPLYSSDAILIDFVYNRVESGWFYIKKGSTLLDVIKIIGSNKRVKTKKIFFYSSDTIDEFSIYFSKLSNTKPLEIKKLYYKYSKWKEAGILASIYKIPYHIDTDRAIRYMVRRSDIEFQNIATKYGIKYPSKEFKKYLIIASIIQKESWQKDDMPKISAVIHNRLASGMKLQMDATLNYGKYSHTAVTPSRIRKDKSHYNTYIYKGLPPEPLGSVTIDALEAAFNPAKRDYLYFVGNIFGTHDFSSSYDKHLANISRIKAQRAKLRKYISFLKNMISKESEIKKPLLKNTKSVLHIKKEIKH